MAVEIAAGKHADLLRRVIEANPVLAGRCLVETRIEAEPEIRTSVVGALLATIDDPAISPRARIAAGNVLGQLGDPRPGEFAVIPAGVFRAGSRQRGTSHVIDLQGYRIGRLPVTNAEFEGFVTAGGYENRRWWTEVGWRWKSDKQFPEHWRDPWFNRPNYPVVGVSWYEAVAYCRWLSEVTGERVRLPTETEWEKAAGGEDGRRFPWGKKFDSDLANLRLGDEPVNRTTPVGIYLAGASPYGLLDCAGQVWEWCVTPTTGDYVLPPYAADATGNPQDTIEGELGRVLRGGSWGDRSPDVAGCAFREWFYADSRSSQRGFRVVAAGA